MRIRCLLPLAACFVLLAGCEVGPDYRRPEAPTPPAFSENSPWKIAAPKDRVPKAGWWRVFADPELDRLEQAATAANPSVQAAFARVEEARAVAQVSLAALMPQVAINGTGARTRYSGRRQLPPGFPATAYTTNSIDLPLDLSYEIDLFGRLRRSLETAKALAQGQVAAYENVLLSLQGDVAQNYFTLRSLANQRAALVTTVNGREQELQLIRKRQQAGASDNLDIYRAESELTSAEGSELAVDQQIATLEHTLAILTGRPPEGFHVEAVALGNEPPAVPEGLPSELLERRPDVSQAERTMAANSAQIGVAKAAFFPRVGLTAFAGFNSTAFRTLFQSDAREWSAGPLLSIPLFQGGQIRANYERSKAAYDEAAANYRASVLNAFRDVEDALSGLNYLQAQQRVTDEGVAASRRALELSRLRYRQGIADYFEVIDAERTLLGAEIQSAQLRGRRFITTVVLIRALGGGW
jgi:multidrug efflux system outer membrane protein